MTNSRKTKRALLSSVTTLLLCFAMLIGSTFAWFTDTAKTGVNTIQAGKLDVALEMKVGNDWVNAEGQTLNFKKSIQALATEEVLWEPGCTYYLPTVRIANNGNLALKYKVVVTALSGDTKLAEVLDVSYSDTALQISNQSVGTLKSILTSTDPDGFAHGTLTAGETSGEITLGLHMQEGAGNIYQEKSIKNLAITVYATQLNSEFDSNGNTYDENAKFDVATTDEELAAALATLATQGNQIVSLMLTDDMSLAKGFKTETGNALALDFNGNTVTAAACTGSSGTETNGMQLLKGSVVTLSNGAYTMSSNNTHYLIQNYSDLTIDNMVLDMTNYPDVGGMAVISTNCGNVVITGNTKITAASGKSALDIMHWEGTGYETEGSHVTFDENFTGVCDGKIDIYCYNAGETPTTHAVDDGGATLTIKGGTFKNTGLSLEQFTAYVAEGYTVTKVADDYYCVGTPAGSAVKTALESSTATATLSSNVTTGTTDTYGTTAVGIKMAAGSTLDGNGYTLSKGDDDGYAILTAGSTIKNVTLNDSGRAIFIESATENTVIENVVINGAGYALNTGGGNDATKKLTVKDSTINGWTSFANLASAEFTNCSFGTSTYYSQEVYQHYLRPYVKATFTNCTFDQGFYIDLTKLSTDPDCKVILNNCMAADGTVLTDANFANYVKIITGVANGADVYATNGDTINKLTFSTNP